MITIETRVGNRARCYLCEQDVLRGKLRVVISLNGSYQPHHYHIECARAHTDSVRWVLRHLEEGLEGASSREVRK